MRDLRVGHRLTAPCAAETLPAVPGASEARARRGFYDELEGREPSHTHLQPTEFLEEIASGSGLVDGPRRVAHALSWTLRGRLRCPAKECFSNALRAWEEPETAEALYCEGFLRDGGGLFEHGWLELPDGTVIDPTIPGATCHITVARFGAEELWCLFDDAEFLPVSQERLDIVRRCLRRRARRGA